MQLSMWLFLLTCTLELQAKDVKRPKWPEPAANLPRWVRNPEDWPDPPTIAPPDPRVVKLQANVKKLLFKVNHASIPKQQWNLAASINDTRPVGKRKGLISLVQGLTLSTNAKVQDRIVTEHTRGLKRFGHQADRQWSSSSLTNGGREHPDPEEIIDAMHENSDYFRKLSETYKTVHPHFDAPSHFHEAKDMFKQVKGFESHLEGLKGTDDAPDEFLWKNLSDFKFDHGFNSTWWKFVCVDDGKHAIGIWKEICETRYSTYHLRFRNTICSADVKDIADAETDIDCAYHVIRDAECSKVFHFIPDKDTPENAECKCVKKDKLCAPLDNDKGGNVYWLE